METDGLRVEDLAFGVGHGVDLLLGNVVEDDGGAPRAVLGRHQAAPGVVRGILIAEAVAGLHSGVRSRAWPGRSGA